ncbi:MAG: type II toxin-antitoxin system VapC family toxin [Nitriliruptorales bacterium]
MLDSAARPLLVPALAVTEVAHLLRVRIGAHAEVAFGRAIASGEVSVEAPEPSEWERIVELTEIYAELPLGLVDASVVALAERLGVTRLATLDHRHFAVIAPRHADAFELLPA